MSFGGNGGHRGHGLDIWSYVARLGVEMKGAGDEFFAEGDKICQMRTCQYLTQIDIEELLHKDLKEFSCQVPGCSSTFKQLHENEAHYNAKHRFSCQECGENLPSAHLLDLHISEIHDTYFQLLSSKKASFECLLESCKKKFWNGEERRTHCLEIHSFPSDFKFDPVVKKRPKKPRPNSVFSPEKGSKLPVLNSRRFSLKDVEMAPVSSSSPVNPIREPLSLAKMGQRLSAKSEFDIVKFSGIPVKKMNSASSTGTSISMSPDRSLTGSPTKSRSTVSNGNPRNADLNGNKSRIPVLRSPSCKKSPNFWYNTIARSTRKSLEQSNFEHDMKMALD